MDNLKAALEAAGKSLKSHSPTWQFNSIAFALGNALIEAAAKLEPTPMAYGRFPNSPQWEKGEWNEVGVPFPVSEPEPQKTAREFFWPSLPSLPSMILVSPSDPNENYVSVETMYAREYQLLEYANAVKKTATDLVDEINAGPNIPHSKAWYMKLAENAARSEQLWNNQWEEARVANKQLEQEVAQLKRKLEVTERNNVALEKSNDELIEDLKKRCESEQNAMHLFRNAKEGWVSASNLPAYEQAAKQQGVNWCIKLLQRIADDHDDKAAKMIGYNVRSRAGNELREAIAKIRQEENGMWADE